MKHGSTSFYFNGGNLINSCVSQICISAKAIRLACPLEKVPSVARRKGEVSVAIKYRAATLPSARKARSYLPFQGRYVGRFENHNLFIFIESIRA